MLASPPQSALFWVGAGSGTVGLLVRLWAAGHVRKSRKLATHGPYAFVRHPQYLGNTLLAVGLSLASGYPWAIGLWCVLFWLLYVPAIKREDDKLRRRFGQSWEKWADRTPAVLPVRRPSSNPGLHLEDWSFWQAIRNGEPAWLALSVGALLYLYILRTGV
jgi:protein-S-isoprenylcysteine O-methyltransferase Ste14